VAGRKTSNPRIPGDDDKDTEVSLPAAPAEVRISEEMTAHTPIPPPRPSRDADLPPGTVLNEYSVDTKIGQGGMGAVFSAVHPKIGKRAAIKVLRHDLCQDPIVVERFLNEARVVNEIGHPNIVDVFAFGQLPDGRSYLVMEWLKGETLKDRLARGPLDPVEACVILRALARALEAAHDKGIIHRDLKPDNVYLVEERDDVPRVKLLDFGIAKLVRADQAVSRTATGAMIGTPQYVAPEQAKGHHMDTRVDIYSLGCVAFEMLSGRPPFEADNPMEMVAKHLMEEPVHVATFVPDVPAELDELVFAMLAKDREQRPTLTEIAAVLEQVQKQPAGKRSPRSREAVHAFAVTSRVDVPPDGVTRVRRRVRRHQRLAKLGILAGGIAMGAVAFMVVSAVTAPAPAPNPAPAAAPAPEPESSAVAAPATAPVAPSAPVVAPPDAVAAEPVNPPVEPVKSPAHVHKTTAVTHAHKQPTSPPPPAPPSSDDHGLMAPGSLDHP